MSKQTQHIIVTLFWIIITAIVLVDKTAFFIAKSFLIGFLIIAVIALIAMGVMLIFGLTIDSIIELWKYFKKRK